jgi:hypothetical protein
LTKAGAERQAYQQSLLDAPLKTATTASGLMRGYTVPQSQTEQFVGPKAGLYRTSDLSNILGVMSMLGATKEGSAGGKLFDFIGSKFSGFDPSTFFQGNGSGFIPGEQSQDEIDYSNSLGDFPG